MKSQNNTQKQLYFLRSVSVLHAGSDTTNSGVIDNLIQRDFTDNFPIVNLSSFKGALKEWFENKKTKEKAEAIFGSDGKKSIFSGSDVHLLALPLKSNRVAPYFMATSPYLIKKFIEIVENDFKTAINSDLKTDIENLLKLNNQSNQKQIILSVKSESYNALEIEDLNDFTFLENNNYSSLKKLFATENILLLPDEDMMYFASDYALPVIARNKLENGQSKQLWYEQVLPRQTLMYFVVEVFDTPTKDGKSLFEELNNDNLVQVGANATVGYGRCEIIKLLENE